VRSASTPKPSKPRRRRGLLLYVLLCILLVVVITIISTLVAVIGNSNAAQQPPTTGAHITSIETGTGFDTEKSLVTGVTHTFKTGQAVYVVFTVKNEDANAQIVLKLFQESTLESTSDILTPDGGTNTYAFPIVVHSTGLHSCHLEYNHSTEATISFNVTL
jgi:hypothetical protein